MKNLREIFQRTTSRGRFIPEVDGIRFIAILSVVLFHLQGQMLTKSPDGLPPLLDDGVLSKIVSNGHIGVQLFFVLSGFILALPFASQYNIEATNRVSIKQYYLRRLTRLEPPYIISLIGIFFLLILVKNESAAELFPHLLASLFYLHNIVFGTGSAINYVTWSLEVEVQFYLLVPAIAYVFKISSPVIRRILLASVILGITAIQQFYLMPSESPRVYLSILGQAQFFLAGVLMADFYIFTWRPKTKPNFYWDIGGAIGSVAFLAVLQWPTVSPWVLPWLIFFVYTAVFRGVVFNRILSTPLLTMIGGMCYSIYLLHFYVIAFVWEGSGSVRLGEEMLPNLLIQFCLVFPVILLVCGAFYLAVEKPCMRREWPLELMQHLRYSRLRCVNLLQKKFGN